MNSLERASTFNFLRSFIFTDHVPSLPGSLEEHDIPLRPWNLPNVRRPDVRMSDMPEGGRQTDFTLLSIGNLSLL